MKYKTGKSYSIFLNINNSEKIEKLSKKTRIRKSEIVNILIENITIRSFVDLLQK